MICLKGQLSLGRETRGSGRHELRVWKTGVGHSVCSGNVSRYAEPLSGGSEHSEQILGVVDTYTVPLSCSATREEGCR